MSMKRRRVSSIDQPVEDAPDYVVPDHAKPLHLPGTIKNKQRRAALFAKVKREREKLRKKFRKAQEDQAQATGEPVPVARPQRTLDNTRTPDPTMVREADEEVFEDEDVDEFASYFARAVAPKVLMTTSERPSAGLRATVREMLRVFPNCVRIPRRRHTIKEMVRWAIEQGYTDLLVWEETAWRTKKGVDSLLHVHLPGGPTAHFRISSLVLPKQIKNHGRPSKHYPELVLNRFDTRLGRTVGRMFAALFPQDPQFLGRRVVTLHNQRDFLFFRHHRYIFESREKVRLQELGPRFTLRLQSLQHGTFDTRFGEYEFVKKPELQPNRKTFVL
jgi:ribosome production factor 1